MTHREKQQGFTLVELLIATAFFSFILLFVTFGYVQINKAYNKGITVKKMHETARFLVEDISRALTSITSSVDPSGLIRIVPTANGGSLAVSDAVCYRWFTGFGSSPRLLKDTDGFGGLLGCPTNNDGLELVDDRIAIHEITIERINTNTKAYSICVIMSTDTDDLVAPYSSATPANSFCKGSVECNLINGDQYCDTVALSTVITLRR